MTGVTFGYGTGTIVTANQWTALFAQCYPSGNISTYSSGLLSGATQAAWFTALGLPAAAPGFANGLATLDGAGKLPASQLTAAAVGGMNYQGTWNASTNNPALASGVGTKGYYYKVGTLGTTLIDGCSSWAVNDLIAFDGTAWDKFDGSLTQILSTQISDSTAVGRALLNSASVLAQRVSLNIDQATVVADANQIITNAMESVVWTSITAARTGTLPAASTLNVGQSIFIFDESGNCSTTNTITLNRSGSDTINGGASYVLNYAYAGVVLTRVSSTKWTAIASSGLGFTPAISMNSISASVASNALTLGFAGTPAMAFRNASLTSGVPVIKGMGALSLVVPSGATLGMLSGNPTSIALLVAYNGGSPVLCCANMNGGPNLDETTLISPTTISAGASSATTIYSASAVSTNSPFRVIGYVVIAETTPGAWSTAPTLVQGGGGVAMAAIQSIGYGQTWQTTANAYSTVYYNTTGRPIMVCCSASASVATNNIALTGYVNGMTIANSGVYDQSTGNWTINITLIIPPGNSYSIVAAGAIGSTVWTELR
jgi:hypothetical protein